MNAVLSIELEILEPALVASAAGLRNLHPNQIRRVSLRMTAPGEENDLGPLDFSADAGEARFALSNLIAFAQRAQPEGTPVVVWYQGRSESFVV